MREWLEKKWVQLILIVIVLFIWGYNTYSIIGVAGEEVSVRMPNRETNINTANWEMPEDKRSTYKANFPDPFKPKIRSSPGEKTEVQVEEQSEEIRIPELTLTGIVENMALVKNRSNQLFFASVGDTIEGARIQFVSKDSVLLTYRSELITLKLYQ